MLILEPLERMWQGILEIMDIYMFVSAIIITIAAFAMSQFIAKKIPREYVWTEYAAFGIFWLRTYQLFVEFLRCGEVNWAQYMELFIFFLIAYPWIRSGQYQKEADERARDLVGVPDDFLDADYPDEEKKMQ